MSHPHTLKLTPTQATQLRTWLEYLADNGCMDLMQREVLRPYMARLYAHGLYHEEVARAIRPSGAQLIALMQLYQVYGDDLSSATKVYYQLSDIHRHTV